MNTSTTVSVVKNTLFIHFVSLLSIGCKITPSTVRRYGLMRHFFFFFSPCPTPKYWNHIIMYIIHINNTINYKLLLWLLLLWWDVLKYWFMNFGTFVLWTVSLHVRQCTHYNSFVQFSCARNITNRRKNNNNTLSNNQIANNVAF